MSIPRIEPIRDGIARPLWSVMIPTYNPDRHLEEALNSVLRQDPGSDAMQIEVVDDRSNVDVARMVANIGKGRVTFRQNESRQGLFGNWNACIKAARGQYVHILHQDDVVLDGFYAAMGQGLDGNPEVGAAFCRHIYIDEDGLWFLLSDIEQRHAGVLSNCRSRFAAGISIQCPAIVVRRSTYEELGGFDMRFNYTGDVEMWLRIASRMPVYHEPRVMACWRKYDRSASTELITQGHDIRDGFNILELLSRYFPECREEAVIFKAKFLGNLRHKISRLAKDGEIVEALRQTRIMWVAGRWSYRESKVALMLTVACSTAWLRRCIQSIEEVMRRKL